jgi:hypothetical protein
VSGITRRSVLKGTPWLLGSAVFLRSPDADARVFGIIFRAIGVGFGTVATLGLGITAIAAYAIASGVRESFSSFRNYTGSGHYTSYAPSGWKSYLPPKPIIVRVSLDPNNNVKGDILRLRALQHNVLERDGIALPNGGRIIIEEDGKMRFADTGFCGYAQVSNDGVLTVCTSEDQLVLTRSSHGQAFHHNFHESGDGRLAVASLLGDIHHA